MRRFLRDLSVGRKLVLIQLISAGVLGLLLSLVVFVGQQRAIEKDLRAQLSSAASVIGFNAIAPLDARDAEAGANVLKSLDAIAAFVQAAIYDADGKIAFTYRRNRTDGFEFPGKVAAGRDEADVVGQVDEVNDHLVVVHPILRKGEVAGTVYLRTSLADVEGSGGQLLLVLGMILVLGLLIVLFLSALLSRAVLKPVLTLVGTMDKVRQTADYSPRVATDGADEFARLGDNFNRMLELVGRRELELEERVKARTEELSQSESRLGQIIASTLEGIIVFDALGSIVLANPAAEELFAARSGDMLTRQFIAYMAPKQPMGQAEFQRYLIGHTEETLNLIGHRHDGGLFEAELRVSRYELGGETFFVAAARDISERRRLEQMKSEFVATVSHELRTPLTSIFGSVKLLLSGAAGGVTDKQVTMLEMARRNCERLINLVNELLDVQRFEAVGLAMDKARVDLGEVIDAVVADTVGMALQYEVAVVARDRPVQGEGSCSGPFMVWGDETRLHQVLVNLVSNAIKHSERGAEVEVGLFCRDDDKVRVVVVDRGEGIPLEHQERIFDKFQRVDSSDSRSKGGTGLGLAIVRAIVEAHGGLVGVDSRAGQGATFWVDLPVDCPDKAGVLDLADGGSGGRSLGEAVEDS